jgi:H+/gluconate symporter-like permease
MFGFQLFLVILTSPSRFWFLVLAAFFAGLGAGLRSAVLVAGDQDGRQNTKDI